NSPERREAYQAHVTYGTNNEFGFDYLRDNMARRPEERVQRKPFFAMVDEVDSVLIDDARTPLIISGPVDRNDEEEFYRLKPRIKKLVDAQKKLCNEFLTEAKKKIEEGNTGVGEDEGGLALLRAHRGMPKNKALIKFLNEPGNKMILQNTENYYLQEQAKNMPFVDQELYFTVDEKNNSIELSDKGIDFITQEGEEEDTFVLPDVGSEIADIEKADMSEDEKMEKKDKVMQDFAVKSEKLHSLQQLMKAYVMFEADVDYVVMDGKVKIVDENTGRILEGRRYSDGLHQAIEAKENVKVEAASQTMATITLQNFFRMYHKLAGMTGTAVTEAGEFWEIYSLDVVAIPTHETVIRDDKDDLIYKTQKEKYNAIIEEIERLREAGRPVLVGTTSVDVSELISRMLERKNIKHNVLNAKNHQSEAEIVAEAGQARTVTIATNMAGRGTDIKLGEGVREAGGLAIIGSERHDSRRVDRQLRGRAGRQGDPGSSQFFVALDDRLMRLFGSERIVKVMDRMGYQEGEVIQHSMVSKSIERAQKKVEENNFGIRKKLLEYDDVMNSQREVVYKKREHALYGERLSVDLNNSFYELAEETVQNHKETYDYHNFHMDVIRFFSISTKITEDDFRNKKEQGLTDILYNEIKEAYQRKEKQIIDITLPVLRRLHESKGQSIQDVAIPFTDGVKTMQVVTNLEEAINSGGEQVLRDFEKGISLSIIDEYWKDHLRQMDELKQSVQGAVYEQKDPLLVYKFEAFKLFKTMLSNINKDITAFLFKGVIQEEEEQELQEAKTPKKSDLDNVKTGRETNNALINTQPENGGEQPELATNSPEEEQKQEPVKVGKKVGRNEPCPCGSGKKYKHCHGKQ
ncbi:MAG: preprotein translocase subunit SecA, partial [Bacteroidetes bacterium SW_11_45_7]